MSNSKYSLDVISHHSDFNNKTLRKYNVDGIETVGAFGSEKFSIKFTNHTYQKVQVKLSLDGTDIITGEKATTDVTKDMWVVAPYGVLELKAFPETHSGGAAFVFTSADNSVAAHLHGDVSSQGIIAAAVFMESYVSPATLIVEKYHYPNPWYRNYPYYYPYWYGNGNYYWNNDGITYSTGGTINNNQTLTFNSNTSFNSGGGTVSCNSMQQISETSIQSNFAAIGAGEYTEQKITHEAGLIKPLLNEIVKVRYIWWSDLEAKLNTNLVPSPHASGFPGDKTQTLLNLGNVPRVKSSTNSNTIAQKQVYTRI